MKQNVLKVKRNVLKVNQNAQWSISEKSGASVLITGFWAIESWFWKRIFIKVVQHFKTDRIAPKKKSGYFPDNFRISGFFPDFFQFSILYQKVCLHTNFEPILSRYKKVIYIFQFLSPFCSSQYPLDGGSQRTILFWIWLSHFMYLLAIPSNFCDSLRFWLKCDLEKLPNFIWVLLKNPDFIRIFFFWPKMTLQPFLNMFR